MKLFRYFRVYSYGDCTDEYIVRANNKDEAVEKLHNFKVKNGAYDTEIRYEYISEIEFKDDIIDLA